MIKLDVITSYESIAFPVLSHATLSYFVFFLHIGGSSLTWCGSSSSLLATGMEDGRATIWELDIEMPDSPITEDAASSIQSMSSPSSPSMSAPQLTLVPLFDLHHHTARIVGMKTVSRRWLDSPSPLPSCSSPCSSSDPTLLLVVCADACLSLWDVDARIGPLITTSLSDRSRRPLPRSSSAIRNSSSLLRLHHHPPTLHGHTTPLTCMDAVTSHLPSSAHCSSSSISHPLTVLTIASASLDGTVCIHSLLASHSLQPSSCSTSSSSSPSSSDSSPIAPSRSSSVNFQCLLRLRLNSAIHSLQLLPLNLPSTASSSSFSSSSALPLLLAVVGDNGSTALFSLTLGLVTPSTLSSEGTNHVVPILTCQANLLARTVPTPLAPKCVSVQIILPPLLSPASSQASPSSSSHTIGPSQLPDIALLVATEDGLLHLFTPSSPLFPYLLADHLSSPQPSLSTPIELVSSATRVYKGGLRNLVPISSSCPSSSPSNPPLHSLATFAVVSGVGHQVQVVDVSITPTKHDQYSHQQNDKLDNKT